MFDSVYVKCKCGANLEFQSKTGPCCLNRYESDSVPVEVAVGAADSTVECPRCSGRATLRLDGNVKLVAMRMEYEP